MVSIERATLADAKAMMAILHAVADEITARIGEGYWSKHAKLDRVRDRLRESDGTPNARTLYVLRDDDRVIGMISISERPMHLWRKRMWAEPKARAVCVFDLVILPERYRQGWGRHLMGFAEHAARRARLNWVRLDAYTDNPDSNAFYRSLGYDNRGTQFIGEVAIDLYEKRIEI